jgi:hypothetical protein
MKEMRVGLDEQEENIIKEFKELEDLTSKEKAIKRLIKKSLALIPELQERIKSKQKYKKKQK